MKRFLLAAAAVALYLLHQDVWFWRTVTPLALGFLPVGIWYHVIYTLAVAVLMWLLVRHAWPSHLEEREGDRETRGQGEIGNLTPSPLHPFTPSPKSEEPHL